MFSYGSESSISSATVTPSLVTLGLPQPLSSTALRPRGPRVERTARASLLTPVSSFCRASSLYASCLAAIHTSPFDLTGLGPLPRVNAEKEGFHYVLAYHEFLNPGDLRTGQRNSSKPCAVPV